MSIAGRKWGSPFRAAAGCGLAALLCVALASRLPAQESELPAAPAVAPEEVRGVWVVRTDLVSPEKISRVVAHARAHGLNTLIVQCRGRGDAFYNDGLEPRAQALSGQPAAFDPLRQIVEEGRAAGLRVHAWLNACYLWSDKKAPASPEHIVNARAEWLGVRRNGQRCRVGEAEVFACPSHPAARAHFVAVCRDVVRRYDVDGIHLDYIRYPNTDLCYCAGCLARFEETLAARVPAETLARIKAKGRLGLVQGYSESWNQFRREQITSLVREVREAVKAERPAAALTAAVIPWGGYSADFKRSSAYTAVGQDWYGWIREGLVDAVCPMTYHKDTPSFRGWVEGVRGDHPNFPVWFGIGAYLVGPDSAAEKARVVRGAGSDGWLLFSYGAVTRNGADDAYLREFRHRAFPSEMASGRPVNPGGAR